MRQICCGTEGGREGWLPREHLIQDAPECVDIRAGINVSVARGLLWAHVVRHAEAQSRFRYAPRARLSHGKRDTEVGYQRLSLGTQLEPCLCEGWQPRCVVP